MLKKVTNYVFISLGIFWIIFVLNEYFIRHPLYLKFISSFAYWDLLVLFLIFTGIFLLFFSEVVVKNKFEFKNLKISGWTILLYVHLLAVLIFTIYGRKVNIFSEVSYFPAILNFELKFFGLISALYLITLIVFGIGSMILNLLNMQLGKWKKFLYSIAIGICVLVFVMFILGSLGLLKLYILASLLVLMLLLSFKNIKQFIKLTLFTNLFRDKRLNLKTMLLLILLVFIICLNLMNIIRPFPIGWDDMGIYMNIPNIIGQTGELVQGINAYNWSLFMSLGFVLFKSAEVAMGLSLIGGIFSLGAIYKLGTKYVSKFSSLLLVTIFYTLPSIVFQSRMDMKVDLGLLFISAVILLLIFDFIEILRNKQNDLKIKPVEKKAKKKRQSKEQKNKLMTKQVIFLALLIGVLCGFAFGIKYTSFILLVAVFATIAFSFYKIWGAIVVTSIGIFFTFLLRLFSYSGVDFSEHTILFTKIFSLVLSAITILVVAFKKFQVIKIKRLTITFFLITCGILISFGPWIVKNYIETKELSVEGLLYGESQRPTFDFADADQKYDEYVNKEAKEDINKKESGLTQKLNFKSSGQYETVTIYSGYEEGILRYLTLPYDVVMNTNNHPRLTALFDIGYLLLAILPVVVLAVLKDKYPQLAVGLFLVLIVGFLFISYISVIGRDSCIEKNIDTQCIQQVVSQYSDDSNSILRFVNYIVILAAPLLTVLYKLFSSLSGVFIVFFVFGSIGSFFLLVTRLLSKNKKIQFISVFSAVYLPLWLILGNGLYWYGMIGFVILLLIIFILQSKLQGDNCNPVTTSIVKFLVFLWIVMASFSMFLVKDRESTHLFRPYNARYMIGEYEFDDVLGEISPHFVEAKDELNANPEVLIYRVGTMLTYFIDDNYKRVLKDNDLQVFHRLYKSSRSKEEIASKMYLEGYGYILASFGGMNLDVTEGKTLTKKFKAFEEFISNNPKLELITTDRLVIDENGEYQLEINGKLYKVSKKIEGEVVNPGDVILLKIIE